MLYAAWPRILRAPDFPIGVEPKELEKLVGLADRWGEGVALSSFAPSRASDPLARESWARFQRAAASPMRTSSTLPEIDIRDILPAIHAETLVLHRTGDRIVPVACGRYLAEHILARATSSSRVTTICGRGKHGRTYRRGRGVRDWISTQPRAGSDSRHHPVHGHRRPVRAGAAAGDQRWAAMLEAHHAAVRRQLERFREGEIDTAGDGFVAFDGPARGIRCASTATPFDRSASRSSRAAHGRMREGGGQADGIAVNVGARVGALAAPESLVSSTVVDLVAGSGLVFEDRGEHELKGVPGPRRLFMVAA